MLRRFRCVQIFLKRHPEIIDKFSAYVYIINRLPSCVVCHYLIIIFLVFNVGTYAKN